MYTYGRNQNNDYDTVDLYSLIEELEPYTNNTRLLNNLKSSINDLIVINSASDNYSHGISAYFPYFSGNDIINAINKTETPEKDISHKEIKEEKNNEEIK